MLIYLYIFVTPVLTMRLISDDRRNKTDQLLLTSPVSVTSVVLGKFFAAVALLGIFFAHTIYLSADITAFTEQFSLIRY